MMDERSPGMNPEAYRQPPVDADSVQPPDAEGTDHRAQLLREVQSLRDGELDLMLQAAEGTTEGEQQPVDPERRVALQEEYDRRERLESSIEGRETVEQIRENLWLLRKEGSQNPVSVVFRKGKQLFVTDPGVSMKSRAKNRDFQNLQTSLDAKVGGVLLTHSHPDHIGNIPNMAPDNAPIYVHPKANWSLRSPSTLMKAERVLSRPESQFPAWQEKIYKPYARLAYGPGATRETKKHTSPGGRYRDFPEGGFDFDGYSVEVIHTPGHTRGEVCFWIPEERVLVGGDLIPNTHVDRDHIASLYMPEANIYHALDSLKVMRDLRPKLFIPAHGEPIRSEAAFQQRVDEMISLLETTIASIEKTKAEHPDWTTAQIAEEVFKDPAYPKTSKFGSIEKRTMVHSTLRDTGPVRSKA